MKLTDKRLRILAENPVGGPGAELQPLARKLLTLRKWQRRAVDELEGKLNHQQELHGIRCNCPACGNLWRLLAEAEKGDTSDE